MNYFKGDKMKKIVFVAMLLTSINLIAQDTASNHQTSNSLSFSGFAEAYYSYDFNKTR
jgi:hypothetical protein